MGQKVHQIHRFKQKPCILIAIKYPKQAYERDPEVLHLYVKDISLIMNKKKIINKTVKLSIEYPKQAYERDLEVLHLYVEDISLIMNKKKIINKTVKLRKLVLTFVSDFN
jgi:hypothetical protein